MPLQLGAPELLIILVIVVVLFGVGRIGQLGSELGKGIHAFRESLRSPESVEAETSKK